MPNFENPNLENLNQSEPDNSSEREKEKDYVEDYLESVGLKPEDLEGKKVLDIGAGLAEFAREAKKRNIDVTSLEKDPSLWEDEGKPGQETPYIQGSATEMPIKDESFDYVVSKAAPPIISRNKEEVENVIKEAERILKEGGEFHFGPGSLDGEIFSDEELNEEVGGDFQEMETAERKKIIENKSGEFLKSINPNIEYTEKKDPETGNEIGFYVFKKEKQREDAGEEKYYNEDYINEVLESGNKTEMKKLAEVQNLSPEKLQLFSDFAKLRNKTIQGMEKEIEKRQESRSEPAPEELYMGAYIEQIEPQVRETVLNLRNKGYNTYESGFADFDSQRISFNEDHLKDFQLPQELKDELQQEGVEVILESDSIELRFKEFKSSEEIKKIWQKVEQALPNLGQEAEPNKIKAAEVFRQKHSKPKYE